MTTAVFVVAVILGIALVVIGSKWRAAARAEHIRTFELPAGLFEKLRAKHPSLTVKDCHLVANALRHFFLAHLKSGCQFVSMPSQAADDLWHEFILYTKDYADFCDRAFGQFMHHTPAAVLSGSKQSNAGLRRCWWYVCREDNINPHKATRLPLLFALDAKLNIQNGFKYAVDCSGMTETKRNGRENTVTHCAGDFSSPSFDGTTEGYGDSTAGDGGTGDGGGGGCGGGGD